MLDASENADIEVSTGETITFYTLSTKYKTNHNIKVDNKSSENAA